MTITSMKFHAIVVSILIVFNKIGAQQNETKVRISKNCTHIYSSEEPYFVPYTEVYTQRDIFGFSQKKTRTNYRYEKKTTYHERATCCNGYHEVGPDACAPTCTHGCFQGGYCSEPEICKCPEGYELNYRMNKCEPFCMAECINGNCAKPNVCECNPGYSQASDNICMPICDSCSKTEYCAEPEVCECVSGYVRPDGLSNECLAVCTRDCINSDCTKPDYCKCHEGYKHFNDDPFTCEPVCPQGCENGQCTAPNTCTCFSGYKLEADSSHVCEPICDLECLNATCIAPQTCACLNGYVPSETEENACRPFCSYCEDGRCTSPGQCTCDEGFQRNVRENICLPIHVCLESCYMGICTSPDTCTCFENYEFEEGSKHICKPICSNACINGYCALPEQCACNDGYAKSNFTDDPFKCIPVCECENGYCDGTSSICSSCSEGYDLTYINNSAICEPHCEGGCANGECIGPQTCHCHQHYIASNDSEGNSVCIHPCGMKCSRGICLEETGVCDCSYGWSGKYCDQPLLCSITFLENEPIYSQLNESIRFDEFENATIIDESWPICNKFQCSKKINNSTTCTSQFDGIFSNITCLINLDLECNIYSHFRSDANKSEVTITIVVISSILTLFVLAIAIYGALFVRRSTKLSTELMESIQEIQKHQEESLIDNETSSISL